MKKLMALTLALVLALSLGVTALAKDAPIPEGAKAKIFYHFVPVPPRPFPVLPKCRSIYIQHFYPEHIFLFLYAKPV